MSILTSDSNSGTQSVDWESYRLQNFPITKNWIYLDHAAVSPLSQPAASSIRQWLEEATEQGDTAWPKWANRLESIRESAASLINASIKEIAFVHSTTAGINLVAEGIPWNSGDNIVIPEGEFPSNLYPWMNLQHQGVELRQVARGPLGEIELNRMADACDSKTRLLAASWVGFGSGFRVDPAALATVAHDHGALFFLDAIQGLGVFPLDVKKSKVDFLAADGHKWMMGPEGAGLFYCQHDHLDLLKPTGIGWNSVQNPYDFSKVELTLKDSAGRFEGGTQNMCGVHAMGASIELLQSAGAGPENSLVGERVLEISDMFCEKMQAAGFVTMSDRRRQHASGIVSFQCPNSDAVDQRQKLLDRKVVSSVRNDFLRFSPHAYNNLDDVEATVKILTGP